MRTTFGAETDAREETTSVAMLARASVSNSFLIRGERGLNNPQNRGSYLLPPTEERIFDNAKSTLRELDKCAQSMADERQLVDKSTMLERLLGCQTRVLLMGRVIHHLKKHLEDEQY